MRLRILHSIIYHSKINPINLYLENRLIQNFKVSSILIFIHTKMRMFMILECRMMGQTQKICKTNKARIQNSANNIFMISKHSQSKIEPIKD